MKTAIITDIHANREAFEACLAHAEGRVDGYAILGDLVGYGADPGWVVDRVAGLAADGAPVVRGNHDLGVVEGAEPRMNPDARQVVEWTRGRLDAAQLAFLAGLPLEIVAGDYHFVHASPRAPRAWEYVNGIREAERAMAAAKARITVCGHVHQPALYHVGPANRVVRFEPSLDTPIPLRGPRAWLVVPGSAGQPRDGDQAACYAVIDQALARVTFHRVPYDHETAAAKIRAAGLPESLARRLTEGG
ncbi:MAG: metallophosphoesterase [Alphaproteobacteria bacterium]|nr:metallophosphoesterase [Alphaproteobacteria bacterium]